MPYDVAIVPCADYSEVEACRAVSEVLEPLGGLCWVKPGMVVAVKVNLVTAMKPEAAATTHPALVRELCRQLTERGAEVYVGDSPGGPFAGAYLNTVYSVTGMRAAEQAGARLNRDCSSELVRYPQGHTVKEFMLTSWLNKADMIINFCKLKTHGVTAMSCAVKNLFGVVPGTRKPEMHYLFPDHSAFSNMLVDLCEYVRPGLTIVDAVTAMEGNGPTQGRPRHMGALVAGLSAHNVDLLCSGLIGLRPRDVSTVACAIDRGLCPGSADKLSVFGKPDDFAVPGFDAISGGRSLSENYPAAARMAARLVFGSTPRVIAGSCVGCGKCAQICPAKAVAIVSGTAKINRRDCIRCFCCQEFCPAGAVVIRRSPIARLLGK